MDIILGLTIFVGIIMFIAGCAETDYRSLVPIGGAMTSLLMIWMIVGCNNVDKISNKVNHDIIELKNGDIKQQIFFDSDDDVRTVKDADVKGILINPNKHQVVEILSSGVWSYGIYFITTDNSFYITNK